MSQRSTRVLVIRALIVMGIAIFLLLMPLPFEGRAWRSIGDLAHAPLFGLLAFAALLGWERLNPLRDDFKRRLIRSLVVIVLVSLFGATMELVQQRFQRSASWHDAMSNCLGVTAAVFIHFAWQWRRWRPARKLIPRALYIAAGCLLAIAWHTPASVIMDVVNVRRNFPLLASFESPAELQRFWFSDADGRRVQLDATDGRYSLDVVFDGEDFPRFTLVELGRDWSGMTAFEMDVVVVSPEMGTVEFLVKILDQTRSDFNDSFSRTFELRYGEPQRIRIDCDEMVSRTVNRPLDLALIDYIDFGFIRPSDPVRLRVDRIRLVP